MTQTANNRANSQPGYYTFTNLISGTYYVSFTLPQNYTWTVQTGGVAVPNNSDANVLTGATTPVTLNAGSYNGSVDAGIVVPPVSLGNRVWFDTNDNGVADATEQNAPNVVIELYQDTNGDGVFNVGDAFITTTTTNSAGYYTFTNLTPSSSNATRYIAVITSTNFVGNGALAGYCSSNSAADNDRDHGTEIGTYGNSGFVVASSALSLTLGGAPTGEPNEGNDPTPDANSNQTIDFGFYKLTLGNLAWEDFNNDGQKDAGEPGIGNVPVALYDNTGTTVLQGTTTDANGVYTFTGLTSGIGYVVGITLPVNYVSSRDSASPINNVNNDDNGVNVSGATVKSNAITLQANEQVTETLRIDVPAALARRQQQEAGALL